MSTIAVNSRSYVNTNTERVSFTEKLKKYFKENSKMIAAGLFSANGNLSAAAQMYRLIK